MNRARGEEEEEIRMYDSLIYVTEKESEAGREERRHDPLSSRHHFICRSPLQLGLFELPQNKKYEKVTVQTVRICVRQEHVYI